MNNKLVLRLEAAALTLISLYLYYSNHYSWMLFGALILVPDISLIGYSVNNKVGALFYNIFHTEVIPVALYAYSLLVGEQTIQAIALIWFCHINADRMLGIGLKTTKGFKFTHLGQIG